MVFLLVLLGFVAVAAGVFGVGLGVPLRDTSFGAALLMAGSVAVTGGFILVGLAATLRELRRIVHGFRAPSSGMPRPVRPLERRDPPEHRDSERIEGGDRRMEPRQRMPVSLRAERPDMVPAKFDGADTRERWRKPGPEEWLLRAMAEIESAPQRADAAPAPIDYHPSDIRQQPSNSRIRPAISLAPDHGEAEMRETELHRTTPVSMPDLFDAIWPPEHCGPEDGPEQRTEPAPKTGRRSTDAKSPPLSPAHAVAPAAMRPVRADPMRAEPWPSPILKSGVIQHMAYTLFTDGSIEAQMSEGTVHFASIEEFRRHLEESQD
jgi:hypothetical protein